MNDAYMPAPSRNAARFVVHTPRTRISAMSTSGSRLRTSTAIQAMHTATPTANRPMVLAPPPPPPKGKRADGFGAAPTPNGGLRYRDQHAADPDGHQRGREPVHVAGRADRRLGDEAPRAHRRHDGHEQRKPEQPVPAQVLDDQSTED